MTFEKTIENTSGVEADKITKIKEELKKLRDEAKEMHQQEIKEGVNIKNAFNRHLLGLTDEDIENAPDELLEFLDELNNKDFVDIDIEYDKLAKKINNLLIEDKFIGIKTLLAHKLAELTTKRKIAA